MANNATIAPISVPPSQQWDGNDGPWSSFAIHVGTPPQPARVLISTTVGETWIVSANTTQGGCLSNDPSSCAQSRGGLVNVNTSSTWQDRGIFALGDEINLPDYNDDYANGDYGLETLGLGLPGSNGVTLNNMVVAALATKDFYVGNLGINQQPTNFSTFTDTHTSFLKSLKQQGHIPSLSYGYTAGNQYRSSKNYGSLMLGGYDASKFNNSGTSFQFAGDISRDLVVGLQSVTYSDSKTTDKQLLSEGILAFVDATIPHIWLPQTACTAFEQAFGIQYNQTVNRYLVNDTLHTQLHNSNASVSFILGNQVNGGQTVNITLPYAAFDLEVGPPTVNTTQRYFPLRQAANSTQYTLGRTFLQESYLIVDYERSNFSISPALFSNTAPSDTVAILTPSNQTSLPPNVTKTTKSTSNSISPGAIAGIVIGIVALALLAAAAAVFLIRKRRRRKAAEAAAKQDEFDPMAKAEMAGDGVFVPNELFGTEGKHDSKASSGHEMEGSKGKEGDKLHAEMEGTRGGAEMEGGVTARRYAEMEGEGGGSPAIEMWAGSHGLYDELDSPTVAAAASNGAGRTSSAGGRTSSGVPSPLSPPSNGDRPGVVASWGRRQRPVPRPPGAHLSSGGEESMSEMDISSQDEFAVHPSSRLRAPRPTPNRSHNRTPQSPLHESDDGFVSSPTSSSANGNRRDRHRQGAEALTRRLQSNSSRSTAPISSPSPEAGDRHDRWNQRFGISPPSQTPSEGHRGDLRRGISGSENEISGPSSPSDKELPSRPSPAAVRDTRGPRNWTRRLSSRIISSGTSSDGGQLDRGGLARADSDATGMVSPASETGGSGNEKPHGNFF